jgi:hypothetical protein
VVMNYNWEYGWLEENFSLWTIRDKWEISFVRKYRQNMSFRNEKWVKKTVNWTCYERLINWVKKTSCYREIK